MEPIATAVRRKMNKVIKILRKASDLATKSELTYLMFEKNN